MELRHLQVFRAIADSGSVSGAALLLHVTPSAVSQSISALQREFDTPLTEKIGRKVGLTDAGIRLAEASVHVEVAMEEARDAVHSFLKSSISQVSVCAFHSAAAVFFPPLAMISLDGGGTIACRDEDVDQASFPRLTLDNDIVIAHRMSNSAPWPDERLRVVPLLREPLDVAVSTRDSLASKVEVSSIDLISREWVSSREGFPPDDMLKAIAAMSGRPPLIRHRVNDVAAAAAVVRESSLLALMPRYMATLYQDNGLALLPVHGINSQRHVDALVRPEQFARTKVRATLEQLEAIAGSLVPNPRLTDPVENDEDTR